MAYEVAWSRSALEDVEAIAIYISRDSISYAAAVVKKILDSTNSLKDFPFLGRVVPEFEDENIREVFAYSYRIVYRIQGELITIASVIHGKRLLISEQ
jgi:plasmid stabilization system protein ParE